MKQLYILITILILGPCSVVFASNFEAIKKNGIIKIAVDTTYPPMEFEGANGEITGLDIDLARALAKNLNLKAEFVVMPWDGILAGLKSNRYHIIMSSMNITPEREKEVKFVPYMKMGQVFVTKTKSQPVVSEKDLAGKRMAVQVDTTSYSALLDMQKRGIQIKEIKTFPGATETFSALRANQADAILTDEAVGRYYASLDSKTFAVTGMALKPELVGIAVKKEDAKLHEALTQALATIQKDGTYSKLYKNWLKANPSL